ncbi:MAG: rhodanese-like domain-containing protein [Gammaproteobacteria bacterium]|nr:MAG: rhodanese-like domain-containing protein [Gammaproteobacteria bacterium]
MPSAVSEVPAAEAAAALRHFESGLAFETDCWDVHEALGRGPDFVLIDVRSPEAYARGAVPSAINIPHAKIIGSRMAQYPPGTLFVVYCGGPHCNGAQRGAIRLARLGLSVKLMVGGMTGWLDEGFAVERAQSAATLGYRRISAVIAS